MLNASKWLDLLLIHLILSRRSIDQRLSEVYAGPLSNFSSPPKFLFV